jgi:membrane protein DedA with SNARE-associated domain
MLLAMGALCGSGAFSLPVSLALSVGACLLADNVWYWMGTRRGASILKILCKISLEPDSCVRRTENMFLRYGEKGLLFAKFVPGLSAAAAPLAGMFGMNRWRFVLFDGVGALIWAAAYIGLGWAFGNELERLAAQASVMGSWLFGVLGSGFALYLAWKFIERRRFYRELRIARISPDELREMLDAGDNITVVDLRSALEWEEQGAAKLPGALHMSFEELEKRLFEIPLDRDVILYCT